MITHEKYIVLDDVPTDINSSIDLCILNYNILLKFDLTQNLIKRYPNITFWIVTDNFSKEYIQLASKLGIQNVIQNPIKTEYIEKFFENKREINHINIQKNYTPLEHSSILIVDDNLLNIKLLKETLDGLGITIKSCLKPEESLELIKKEKFNLFLLDILMPKLSGFELAEIIKNSELNSTTPIIFISAISGTENIINGYNMGAYSYIEKPFHPNIVKSQIYNILKSEEQKFIIDKEKENFVATLTHDLKSPINAEILALNYILKNPQKTKSNQSEMISDLLNSAKYMKLITDRILTHYKQKNSNTTLKKEYCSIKKIIIDSIEELKYLSSEKNIQIRLHTKQRDYEAFFDPIEIKRVINNLLSNAIEYSNEGGYIDITLKKEDNIFIFIIKDYGIGIDSKNISKVFDEYMTLAKKHKKVGFGLGLKICESIIHAHGGEISISGSPNKGTKVIFSIPIINNN